MEEKNRYNFHPMFRAILLSLIPIAAYGVWQTTREIKAAKLLSFGVSAFKPVKYTPLPDPKLKGKLESILSLAITNPTGIELKARAIYLEIFVNAKMIGVLSQKKPLVIHDDTTSVHDITVVTLAQPFIDFAFDYFRTSQVPVKIKGYIEVYAGVIGTYVTVPVETAFNLKDLVNKFSAEYLADLVNKSK